MTVVSFITFVGILWWTFSRSKRLRRGGTPAVRRRGARLAGRCRATRGAQPWLIYQWLLEYLHRRPDPAGHHRLRRAAVLAVRESSRRRPADGTTGHVWDEDLTELNTPMPRWWMWLFYITIVFGAGLPGPVPGPGHLRRQLGWKSTGQYEAS
jgi:hypothetical protein